MLPFRYQPKNLTIFFVSLSFGQPEVALQGYFITDNQPEKLTMLLIKH